MPGFIVSCARRPGAGNALVLALAFAVALACGATGPCGCGEAPAPAPAPPPRAPERVVSLSPVATRFLVAIGAGPLLVGVDAVSAAAAGTPDVAVVDADGALALAPDVVVAPPGPPPGTGTTAHRLPAALHASGADIVVFDPHDLEDVYALAQGLGARLVGSERALRFESGIGRPVGIVGGASPERDRLRVAGVVSVEPLVLAGGHSFETDLIEIGGGTSVTHGGEETRIDASSAALEAHAPDLIVVFGRERPDAAAQAALRAALPLSVPVDFFAFDRETFWLDAPAEVAADFQRLVARHAAHREAHRRAHRADPASPR